MRACPFCGARTTLAHVTNTDPLGFSVQCVTCRAYGPEERSEERAAIRWQQRCLLPAEQTDFHVRLPEPLPGTDKLRDDYP